MATPENLIQARDVRYQFPKGEKLSFPELKIPLKTHTLLLGNSGSGKTTLLHILCGLLKPSQGEIFINDQAVYDLSPIELDRFRGQNIGIVFQNVHLIESLSIFENIQLAQNLAGSKTVAGDIDNLLDQLGLIDHKNKFPRQLSRGQAQRVAIGRALINRPALLVADEPTASLDDYHTKIVLDLFFEQADKFGATLVVATHDQRIKERFENTYFLTKQ